MDVAQAIDVAGIKPVIDRTCDYVDARAAFAHLDSCAHFGKVVIRCT
ncbi:zinc-binding dehydrogenase [Pseudomonas viridiflava]